MREVAATAARYLEIADELRRRIQAGDYPQGTALPTIGTLCIEFSSSPHTVRQALRHLDTLGLTAGSRGRPRLVLQLGSFASTRHAQIAELITQKIADGKLRPGTFLPAETLLASQHEVSRATVRQALQHLEAVGAITRRGGRRAVAGTAETPELAYERLAAAIRRQILPRRRSRDAQLAGGELQLAAEYGVSRPTVRKALDLLSQEGLVYSVPKVGWFVSGSPSRSRRRDG